MTKYRYKDGTIIDNAKEASDFVCNQYICCHECPLNECSHQLSTYCSDDSAEEAFIKLYKECGFEEVEETEQSRLAEILGVEEDQKWAIKDNPNIICRIHLGERQWRKKDAIIWETCPQETVLATIINNPDLIRSADVIQWTEREIEIVRAWKVMNPHMTQFAVSAVNDEEIEIDGIPLTEDPDKCPNFFACDNTQISVADILDELNAV